MTHFKFRRSFLSIQHLMLMLTSFIFLSTSVSMIGQHQQIDRSKGSAERCGIAEEIHEYKRNFPKEHEEKLKQFEDRVSLNRRAIENARSIDGICPNGITVIPIAFQIFHDPTYSSGQGDNFSQAQLRKAVNQLNADFAGLNLNKYKITNEFQRVDPGHSCIQFVIGKINRIDRTSCSFWSDSAVFYDLHNCLPGGSGIGSANDPMKYLNVYLSDLNSGLLGQASCIPPVFETCNTEYDGVILNSKILIPYQDNPIYESNNEGSVFAHEVGHWLGLPHVDGDIAGSACTGDDGFNDTNSQAYKTRFNCSGAISKTCSTTDNVFNYMDYAGDCSTSMFTKEQRQAMLTTMDTERAGLKSSYSNGNYNNNLYSVDCQNNLADPTNTALVTIDCIGSVNLLDYMISWYPSRFDSHNITNGLQTFSWSKKGLNGAYLNSYVDIGGVDFVHDSSQATDTTLLTLTLNCWDPISERYFGGVVAGTVKVVTSNCAATNNDLCSSAIFVESNSFCVIEEFPYYSVQSEGVDLSCGLNGTNRDLWFKTTVPVSGSLSVETVEIEGELKDMTMEVYAGSCSNLILLDCNDDFEGSLHSKIMLENRVPNEDLYIRISESEGDQEGLFGLCIVEVFDNDDCVDAFALPMGTTCNFIEFPIVNATPSDMSTESQCSYLGPANDVWFSFISPSSGHVIIELMDSESQPIFDSVIEVYRGACGSLEQIACNGYTSAEDVLNFLAITDLNGGEEIFIRMNTYGSYSEGNFKLCVYDQSTTACSLNFIELGAQSSCDPATNSFSQDIIIHYNENAETTELYIHGNYFDVTTSPQLISIDGLPAHGGIIEVYTRIFPCIGGYGFGSSSISTLDNCYSGIVNNDECTGAIALDVNSTCIESIFDNTGATASPGLSFCNYAGNRPQDVWFSFVVPNSGDVIINLWQSMIRPVFNVYEGDCTNLILAGECGSDYNSIRISGRTPGAELYVHVATESGANQGEFGICIIEPQEFTNDICSTATTITINNDCSDLIYSDHLANAEMGAISCDGTGNNSVDVWFYVELSSGGNASIVIEEAEMGSNTFVTEVYTGDCSNLNLVDCFDQYEFSLSGFSANESVWLRIADYGSYDPHAFSICATVIPNDICTDAIPIEPGNCAVFSNVGATPSDNPQPGLLCGRNGVGNDVWFKTTVPASGQLTIETNQIADGLNNLNMEVYSGVCDDLITIACSNEKNRYEDNFHALVELENLIVGDDIYIRIIENYSNSTGDFEVCVKDQAPNFSCRIFLIEEGAQSECDPINNTFDQEFIVSYTADVSAYFVELNNYSFTLTQSPQTITFNDLPANGGFLDIRASIYGDGDCVSAIYYAEEIIIAPPNCFAGNVSNDICSDAINLSVNNYCSNNIFDNTGATFGFNSDYSYLCGAGENPQDLWFTVVVPESGELIVNTWDLSRMSTVFTIYSGDCNSLNYLLECGRSYSSQRVQNRTPGEVLYIQVADGESDEQGAFGICVIEPEVFSNDVCTSAIEVPVTSDCSPKIYSDHFATSESNPLSCDESNNPVEDMWFKVIVPHSGNLEIFTSEVERGYSQILIEVFIGSCISVFSICDFSSGQDGHSYLDLTGLVPDAELFIKVASYGAYSNNAFRFCATTSCPDNDYITSNFNSTIDKKARMSITADNIIETGGDVIYDAPQSINLIKGFEVQRGSIFETILVGCN